MRSEEWEKVDEPSVEYYPFQAIHAWQHENGEYEVVMYQEDVKFLVAVIQSAGTNEDASLYRRELREKDEAERWAKTYMKRHPNPEEYSGVEQLSYEGEKAALSEEGRRILDETGYQEVKIPVFWEDSNEYIYVTVDFVSDEISMPPEDADDFNRAMRDYQREVAESLWGLIRDGKVMSASNRDEIRSVEDIVAFRDRLDVTSGVR